MTVERTSDEIIIRLPATVDTEGLQNLVDYLVYREATATSSATQPEVDALAAEVKQGWWAANKSWLVK